MDDASLRSLFHGAIDEVTPPKPWLDQSVRDELRRYRLATPARRGWWRLSPTTRRLAAAVLVLLIAGTAAAATIAIYERTHHVVPVVPHSGGPVARNCSIGSGGTLWFDRNTAWRGTQRTTDGGKTWREVGPTNEPGATFKSSGAICALGPDVAWVTYNAGSTSMQPTQVVLLSTHDGGQSWQQDSVIPIPFAVTWKINFSVELTFLDQKRGWLLMQYATNPQVRILYATSDSGAHWAAVSRATALGLGLMAFDCEPTGVMFATVKRGWLLWDCNRGFGDTAPAGADVVAVTNDGGVTWAPVQLPSLPSGAVSCTAVGPVFSGDHGMLQLDCGGFAQPGRDVIYSTQDLGQTWAAHVLDVFTTVDILNGTTGFYFSQTGSSSPNTLYRTTDGGADWSVVASGLFPGKRAGEPTFLDDKTGYVDVGDPTPWWTEDGGRTWSLPAPYHSVGNTVCNVFTDPGTNVSLPQNVQMFSPTAGWATGTRRTADGGATWMSVAPPAPKYRDAGYGEFYLDADHAWVVDTAGSRMACADHFVVYSTSDGGASWAQLSSTPVPQLDDNFRLTGAWTVSVEFVDAQTGWVLVQRRAGMAGLAAGPLFKTVDGGNTWTLLAASPTWSSGGCSGAGLPVFSSPTTGFIADTCTGASASSDNVLVTRDGGQTWSNIELLKNQCTAPAYPNGCPFGGPLPHFVDGANGWWIDPNDETLLMTTDAGQTWTRRALPRSSTYACQGKYGPTTCQNSYVDYVTFVSAMEGWLTVIDVQPNGPPTRIHVERTTDGGRTWLVVYTQNVSPTTYLASSLTFVDASHGFWWLGLDLYETHDGGHTWAHVRITYS